FDVHDRAGAAQASAEFGRYIDELITVRRQEPRADFIGMLIESEVEGHRLTDQELHSFCTVLFGAGFETTADAMSVMLYYLAEHPAEYQQLAAQPQLISSAVEEFLRYISPIQIFGRNAMREVELHGQTIQPMDVVALSFGSANHDPRVFPDPERCAPDRTPNPHLAFGAGIHLCLGAPVARLEMQVTLEEFTRRIPGFHLVPQAAVAWKTRGDRRGLAAVPAVLTS
ncbi:MAG TPA: cytochrome P450, partial [Anaerolineae bacterium]|nr:cytochrome P450 [Anaerolineae bacterium]